MKDDDDKKEIKNENGEVVEEIKKKKEEPKNENENPKKSILSKVVSGVCWLILYINNRMDLAFYWAVFNSMQVDLFLGSWAAFKALDFGNINTVLSLILPIAFIINYFIFMIYITKGFFDFYLPKTEKTYSKEFEKAYREVNKTYLSLFDDLKDDTVYGLWILGILSTKDTFLPFLLIYGINNPLVQTLPILLMFLAILLFVGTARPFKSKVETWMTVFNSLAYVVTLIMFLLLEFLKNTFSEIQKYQIIGNMIIISLAIIVIVNLTVGLCCTIAVFWPYIKKCIWGKEGENGVNKIQPSDNTNSLNESNMKLNISPENKKKKRNASYLKKKNNRLRKPKKGENILNNQDEKNKEPITKSKDGKPS